MPLDSASLSAGLIDAAPDAMFVVDVNGEILLANVQAGRLFGYRHDELLGQSIDMLLPDALRAGHVHQRKSYGEAPVRRTMGEFDMPARRNDGSEVWISVSLSPLEVSGRRLVIAIARDVTERRQMQERLRYLGSHDALTELYNRAYFDEELARIERGRMFPISLVVVDLDGLKQVNDSEGHGAGDQMIRRAAGVLRAAYRAEDVIARLGGDEFGVVLPGVVDADLRKAVARTRRGAVEAGVELSIGGASAYAGGGVQRAFQQADRAMYADKAERRADAAARGAG